MTARHNALRDPKPRSWELADRVDFWSKWVNAGQSPRPLPVPSTPLGLRRKS